MIDEATARAMTWEGTVPLEQVLQYALPAYGGDTLTEAIAKLRSWPSEQAIVDQLAAELGRDPQMLFEEPVRLYFVEPRDWDDEDQAEFGDRPVLPRVGNGMHRIAAADQAGARHLRVIMRDLKDVDSPYDGELIHVNYRLSGGQPGDPSDFAFDWLRSFRLAPGAWAEAATQGSCNDVVESIYHCPHRLQQTLVEELHARAGRHGMTLEAVRARPVTWDLLEREGEE